MTIFKSKAKLLFLRLKYFSKSVTIGNNCLLSTRTSFEGNNCIGSNSQFIGDIGYGSYIGRNCSINATIGRFCSIADKVCTVAGSHPTSFVSTHPAFFSTKKQAGFSYVNHDKYNEIKYADDCNHIVTIGNDVWIGFGALLLQGIHIGDGAIIGAGAVVTKDVEPYSIVAGVPAKLIKKRFSNIEVDLLLKSEWWNKDIDWIRNNIDLFTDVEAFLKKAEDAGEDNG